MLYLSIVLAALCLIQGLLLGVFFLERSRDEIEIQGLRDGFQSQESDIQRLQASADFHRNLGLEYSQKAKDLVLSCTMLAEEVDRLENCLQLSPPDHNTR